MVTRNGAPGCTARTSFSAASIVRKPSPNAAASLAPVAVSDIRRPSRNKSSAPRSCSSARTCCATAAWVTFSTRAAAENPSSRAVASKARSAVREGKRGQSGPAICNLG